MWRLACETSLEINYHLPFGASVKCPIHVFLPFERDINKKRNKLKTIEHLFNEFNTDQFTLLASIVGVFGSFDYLPYLNFKQNVTIFHNALSLYILIHIYQSHKWKITTKQNTKTSQENLKIYFCPCVSLHNFSIVWFLCLKYSTKSCSAFNRSRKL